MDAAEKRALETNWWALTIRGIAAIIFGIAAVFWPGITLLTLVYIFSAWILVDGVIRMVMGLTTIGHHKHWLLALIIGLIEVGVGVYLLRHPGVSFATLILLIGFFLIVAGVIEVVSAFTAEEAMTYKTMSIIWGLIATLAGIVLLFQPESGGVAFVWILGLFALVTGPVLIALSIDARKALDSSGRRK